MSPRLFGQRRKELPGYVKIRSEQSADEGASQRESSETALSAGSKEQSSGLRRAKTAQSETTTVSRGSRRTHSGSSNGERHPWTSRFSLTRPHTAESDILEQSQQAAIDRTRKKEEKAARKREEKEKKAVEKEEKAAEKREWSAHLAWFNGAHLPGYWVI